MENLTQQQIEALIQFIDGAEDPATVTNTIVAAVLTFLADKAAGMTTAQALLEELAAADSNLSTRITQLQQLIQSIGSVVYLDSMGEDLDGALVRPDSGMLVYDPDNMIIKKYTTPYQYDIISLNEKFLYCNRVTGYFYRSSSHSGMVPIGGAADSKMKVINNLTEGGTDVALSAEMGKKLKALIDAIGSSILGPGTYAGAWAMSKVNTVPFCWLWQETVGGVAISKPIWHIGNSVFVDSAGGVVSVQAAAIPAIPTFSETSGSTVGKGTELTITPDTDSALYYKIDNGNWIISDVAVTIEINATCTVTAKCVNNAGSSSEVPCSLTVSGPQTPRFSAKPGTTIDNNNVVSRGGYVVITGEAGGVLHYKINSGSYIDVNSVGGAAPTAEVQITGATTIMAYNTINGENSEVVTKPYTMAALAAPSMSPAGGQLPAGGGTVGITGPAGASIYYTLDGSTPTDQSTLYTDEPISVSEDKTIKAIAKDDYGYSEVTTETYTVAVDHKFQFKIKLTENNQQVLPPFTHNGSPSYTCSIDWGDGSDPVNYNNKYFTSTDYSNKTQAHTYSGEVGDEFVITIRGSVIPKLFFSNAASGLWFLPALITEVLENTLDCDTEIRSLEACSNIVSLASNTFQNSTSTGGIPTHLTTVPSGLLSHLRKGGSLPSCYGMFQSSNLVFTEALTNELKSAISSCTNFFNMFYGFLGQIALPDDFFDGVEEGTVTNTSGMTHTAGSHVTGDAKKLYDSLVTKMVSGYTSNDVIRTFSATGLSNRNQVPSGWGGTMS